MTVNTRMRNDICFHDWWGKGFKSKSGYFIMSRQHIVISCHLWASMALLKHMYIQSQIMHQSMWCPGGGWVMLEILMKDLFTPLGILAWPYWVILTLWNSDIEFCNYKIGPCRMWRILTSNYDPWWGFWHNLFLYQNPQDLFILSTPRGHHIDWYITSHASVWIPSLIKHKTASFGVT